MRRALPIVAALALVAVLVIGLTQAGSKGSSEKGPRFDLKAALASLQGAPAPLAALHAQAGRLLGGGLPAFRARLRELRGHPVVVNKWGSWCGPCRIEFPVFERVSARLGRRVAFLGLDGKDSLGDARAFLRDFPTPYPSYVDGEEKIASVIGAPVNYPITVFYDARGRRQFVHQGQYIRDADLIADIRRYTGA